MDVTHPGVGRSRSAREALRSRWLTGTLLAWMLALGSIVPAQASGARRLVVGVTQAGWPPFGLVVNGQFSGLSAAFLAQALASDSAEIAVRKFPDQAALRQATCRGEVDVAPDLTRTAERETCLIFSEEYYEGTTVTVAREIRPDLARPEYGATATYVVETGFMMARRLRERFPHAKFLYVGDTQQALKAVAEGRADLYVGLLPAVEYAIRQSALRGLSLFDAHAEPAGALRFAFPRDRAALRAEVNAGLQRITDQARQRILAQWITASVNPGGNAEHFMLSDSERAFLTGLPAMRVSLVQWRPYSYIDQAGQQVGILPDYLAYLSQQLGVQFTLQQLESPAGADRAMAIGGTDIGVYAVPDDLGVLPPRVARPIETYPVVVVGRRTDPTVSGIGQLVHQRVAVVESANSLALLRRDVPSATLVVAETLKACLDLIREGKADVFVGNLAAVDYLVQGDYAGDLKVLGPSGYEQAIGFQVRPGLEPLIPILNRALAAMSEAQRLSIRNRYLTTSYQLGPSWQEILRRSAPLIVLGMLAMAVLAIAYVRLRRETRRREHSERQLQAQLRLQTLLIDAIHVPIAVKDRNGHYTAVNRAFESHACKLRVDILGRRRATEPSDLGHARVAALEEGSRIAMEGGALYRFALDFQDEGKVQHHLCWAQPTFDEAGQCQGVISTNVDVTEIQEARKRSLELEQRLNDITGSLPLIVGQLRRLNEPDGTLWEIIYAAGGAGAKALGLDPERLTGRRNALTTRIHPDDLPILLAEWDAASQRLQPFEFECRWHSEHGTRWISIRAVPILRDTTVVWNTVIVDITEHHAQALALREAKDAAEAALRAKESFLAMMSHEIRTPMNGILGLIELLQATTLTAEQHRMVDLARESGQALGHILDDILDYAKIEAGRLSITPTPLDLRELFDGVLGALLPSSFEKGLHLKQMVDADVPAIVRADGLRLRQILFNLLGNAIKFTEAGSVTLRAGLETGDAGHTVLEVAVEDTGIGIAKDDLARLFAPFVQSERSATRRFGGTGLGLTIARRLAELMGGELTLQSKEGLGTTAVLRVPCEIVRQGYSIAALNERPFFVQVADPVTRGALVAFAVAAGMRSLDASEAVINDGMAFVDQRTQAAGWRRVACLTGELLPLGFRQDERGVWLASNPLRWTAFVAAVQALLQEPFRIAMPTSVAAKHQAKNTFPHGPLILVVEDHPINREVIRRQLHQLGYRSIACNNGQAALTALEAVAFDLVLTDCHMPVMNGFDLTRAIRASEKARVREITVVGLTASVAREEHRLCIEVDMNAFLVKPATLAALRETLDTALRGARRFPDEITVAAGNSILPARSIAHGGFCPERMDAAAFRARVVQLFPDPTLMTFRQALQDDREALRVHLESPSPTLLGKWVHRAGGALTVLDQPYLDELVRCLTHQAGSGAAANVQAAGQALVAMYDHLLELLDEKPVY